MQVASLGATYPGLLACGYMSYLQEGPALMETDAAASASSVDGHVGARPASVLAQDLPSTCSGVVTVAAAPSVCPPGSAIPILRVCHVAEVAYSTLILHTLP